jgi:hypothetical protein
VINKKELEFSGLGMIMSLIFLVMVWGAVHVYWLGEPFKNWSSILISIYILICTWAFPYIIKEVEQQIEKVLQSPLGFLLWSGIYIFYYLISPFLYMYYKFFD